LQKPEEAISIKFLWKYLW